MKAVERMDAPNCRWVLSLLVTLAMGCTDKLETELKPENNLTSQSCAAASSEPIMVNMSDVTSRPKDFEGKNIRIVGYYYSNFEHDAIYPTQRDPIVSDWGEGIWVYGLPRFPQAKGERIELVGIFSSQDRGHLDQWPGSVCAGSFSYKK